MKLRASHILCILLLYPLLYSIPYVAENLEYKLSNYYFLAFTFILTTLNYYFFPLKYNKSSFINLLLLLGTSLLVLINTSSSEYLKPIIFFLFILNIFLVIQKVKINEITSIINLFTYLYIGISLIFLLLSLRISEEDGRFSGFLLSPTVYSVQLEIVLILFLFVNDNWFKKAIIFIMIGFLIFMSGTRLNFAFLLGIPLLIFIIRKKAHIKPLLFLGLIFSLNLLYVAYDALQRANFIQEFNASRYEGGRDASFGLRFHLYKTLLNSFSHDFSFFDFILGKGAEKSRILVLADIGVDILPHNDFLRFIYDFGILAAVLYFLFLYRISKTNIAAFLLVTLYLVAFYHNMIYSFELLAIAILISHFAFNSREHTTSISK